MSVVKFQGNAAVSARVGQGGGYGKAPVEVVDREVFSRCALKKSLPTMPSAFRPRISFNSIRGVIEL